MSKQLYVFVYMEYLLCGAIKKHWRKNLFAWNSLFSYAWFLWNHMVK